MRNVRNSYLHISRTIQIAASQIGCTANYVVDCNWDRSDRFICPASACQGRLGSDYFFPCSDQKYCIHKHLVCDGYPQCEDESGTCLQSKQRYQIATI